jgi:hypothetical protein
MTQPPSPLTMLFSRHTKRREFITLGGVAAWPLAARAQQSSPALIGFLNAGAATILKEEIDAFREGLRSLGHIEGRNVRFEYRFADGYLDRLPALAAELIRLNPNVVVSSPVPANLAIAKATNTIPIVMASGADPVGFGLVQKPFASGRQRHRPHQFRRGASLARSSACRAVALSRSFRRFPRWQANPHSTKASGRATSSSDLRSAATPNNR